ncbi:hypothetical protein L226DRAFT_617285 [Lentinus tigrinus ALCF2SS1-7]|uniref:Uncharacterized protein n=1 Tax=Lentinus tigrinus ALCF2SS1-6 TaxID=1328759 RepID=A0A5C2RQM8_9APHY|nr:hypothetical protein L227DRAFT_657989 [Lentinus tigrinus ALCF2SS1-6]RPD68825.1 hypothetical protein L226DRAFT_617285 [Lentinus tigrinus ALCF2SS1-7]
MAAAIEFPLFLALPSTSQSPTELELVLPPYKCRFLLHVCYERPTSKRAHISDLRDAAVAAADRMYKNRPESDFSVVIYACEQLPSSVADLKCGMEIPRFDSTWVMDNAELLGPRRPLDTVKEARLLGILKVNESVGKINREQIAIAAQRRDSPSTRATLPQRLKNQTVTRIDAVHDGRPIELTGPSITIYHPVFAKFLKYMAEPQEFTSEELDTAHSFVTKAVAYFADEPTRRLKLKDSMGDGVHRQVLELTKIPNSTGRFTSDGAMFASPTATTPDDFCPIIALHELKNEIGEGGCDPIAEAENMYVAYYSSNEARSIRQMTPCPAFIIGSAGPNIQISGGDQFIAQPLGDSISAVPRPNLAGRSLLDDAYHRVARLFRALRVCLRDLDDYYTALAQSMTVPPRPGEVGHEPLLVDGVWHPGVRHGEGAR